MASSSDEITKSQSPTNPSPIPENTLLHPSHWTPYVPHNWQLDFHQFNNTNHVVFDILKGHHLRFALTTAFNVPQIYLHQFWHHMHFVDDQETPSLESLIDDVPIHLSKNTLRRILKLPKEHLSSDISTFDPLPSPDQLRLDLISLGYNGTLTRLSQFKTNGLQSHWFILFNIINKCLTGKSRGHDSASVAVLQMFHAFIFNRHFDYAGYIFDELVSAVNDKGHAKKERKYVPFQRFLQLIIQRAINQDDDIHERPEADVYPTATLQHFKVHAENPNLQVKRIPLELLQYADQRKRRVREYLREFYPSEIQSEPTGSSQDDTPVMSEASDEEDAEGEEVEVAEGVQASNEEDEEGEEVEVTEGVQVRDEGEIRIDSERERRTKRANEVATVSESQEADSDISWRLSMASQADTAMLDAISIASDSLASLDERNIIQSRKVVEIETEGESLATSSRASQYNVSSPLTALHAPPSHSPVSLQSGDSFHGDIPHTPSLPRSEDRDVETGHLSPPVSDVHLTTIEPIHVRTPEHTKGAFVAPETSGSAPPHGRAGVTEGNPATAIPLPAVSAGHPGPSPEVQTEVLSEPGITITLPDLLAFTQHTDAQFAAILDYLKERDRTPTPSPKPTTHTQDLSTDKLKSILLARLLTENPSAENTDLISLLRAQTLPQQTTQAPTPTLEQFDALNAKVDHLTELVDSRQSAMSNSILQLAREVRILQQRCRDEPRIFKRPHDDSDDSDHHEGEKRSRISSPPQTQATEPAAQPSDPTLSPPKTTQHTPMVEKPADPQGSSSSSFDFLEEDEPTTQITDPATTTIVDYFEPSIPHMAKHSSQRSISETDFNKDDENVVFFIAGHKLNETEMAGFRRRIQTDVAEVLRISPEPDADDHTDLAKKRRNRKKKRKAFLSYVNDQNISEPFLEDILSEIFIKYAPTNVNRRILLEVSDRARAEQYEYNTLMLRRNRNSADNARSPEQIKKLKQIWCKKISKVWFPYFSVIRADEKNYTFNEADLDDLEFDDLEVLFEKLNRIRNKKQQHNTALSAVIRSIRRQAVTMSVKDFQLGVEARNERINLNRPDQTFPRLDLHPQYRILKKPEHGVIYINGQGQKRFMRFEELACFSDGTLRLARQELNKRLAENDERPFSDRMNPDEYMRIREGLELINQRLHQRHVIRKLEVKLGLRERVYSGEQD